MIWTYRFTLVEDWPYWRARGYKKMGPGPNLGGWTSYTIRRRA